MKNKKELPLSQQIENMELANKALRNYVSQLEEKLARYERVMQCCPRFQAEKSAGKSCPEPRHTDPYDDFYDDPNDDFEDDFDDDWDDDWDGLEESDFEDDWEEDYEVD